MPFPRLFGLHVFALFIARPSLDSQAQQPAALAEFAVQNRYYWRGIRRSESPVVQPGLTVALVQAPFALSVGGWANRELDEDRRFFRSMFETRRWTSREESAWA